MVAAVLVLGIVAPSICSATAPSLAGWWAFDGDATDSSGNGRHGTLIGTPQFVLDKMKSIQPDCYETFQVMHKAGIKSAMGTDMGYEPGMGTNAQELEIYVDLGMTPMEAIMTTTRNAAEALGMEEDIGAIEAGKFADILAIDGNPLDDIRVLQDRGKIQMVMKEGEIFVDRRPGHSREVVHAEPDDWAKIDA